MNDGDRQNRGSRAAGVWQRRVLGAAVAALAGAAASLASIPLGSAPAWTSDDEDFATGGMLWDLDDDGYLDLVVGNGNDMASEHDAVFFNRRGELEEDASWRSADEGYDGHLDMGDVDGDGDLDVVITGFLEPNVEQLYRNDGGVLTASPAWTNDDEDTSFSCALGDVDGDGDPDLATVTGYFQSGPVLVYENRGGTLERTASWRTPAAYDFNDVDWCDVDDDGDLDLAAAGHRFPCCIFENVGGVLNVTPAWKSRDAGEYNQLTFGDVNGDGWRDMVVSDNAAGLVELYLSDGGRLRETYDWSANINYASCVKLADADGDGDPDLAAGGWWSPIQVFENDGGSFGPTPAWEYYPAAGSLVCEQATWGDVDNDGLRFVTGERRDGDGARKLFYLAHAPLHAFTHVRVDGRQLAPAEYCFHPENGWVSLAAAPRAGAGNVEFGYIYSTDLELAVTNWDEPGGNYVFENAGGGVEVADFRVAPKGILLELRWRLAGGGPVAGFNVYRRRVAGGVGAGPVAMINGGLITGDRAFSYLDRTAAGGVGYDYWLEAVEEGGGATTFGPRRGWAPRRSFTLAQNYPNPARMATTIPFALDVGAAVELALFDLAGRRVAVLWDGYLDAGGHEVGVDVAGLAPGVYLYRLQSEAAAAARKMVVVR